MSIEPDRKNFSVWRGATFRKVLTLHESDLTSPPRNLTGFTARMVIKSNGAVVRTLTTENGGISLGGVAGTITLHISDEDTATQTWKSGTYTLFLTNPAGDTDQLLYGSFAIKEA